MTEGERDALERAWPRRLVGEVGWATLGRALCDAEVSVDELLAALQEVGCGTNCASAAEARLGVAAVLVPARPTWEAPVLAWVCDPLVAWGLSVASLWAWLALSRAKLPLTEAGRAWVAGLAEGRPEWLTRRYRQLEATAGQ